MIQSFILGVGGMVLLMVLWAVVQNWWGKTFAEHMTDEDVLAGRTKCSNCGCTTVCERKGGQVAQENGIEHR